MKQLKDVCMMSLCAIMLAFIFMIFAVLALFSETARWVIDQSMHKVGEIMSEGEERSIRKHREEHATGN